MPVTIRSLAAPLRRLGRPLGAALVALTLAACDASLLPGGTGAGGGTVQVALLVPSGTADPNLARLAGDLTGAARLAAAEAGDAVELRVFDTGGSAQRAASLGQSAVAEGADIIIGPLFSDAANATGLAVAETGTSVISFSNTTVVAGGNVFVSGFTFENAAARLLGYGRSQGRDRVLILNAADAGERLGRDAITRAAAQSNSQVVGAIEFPLSQEGVNSVGANVAEAVQQGDVELLFLTSSIDGALPFLARRLTAVGLTPAAMQKAGLTRWDSIPAALGEASLEGGWFTRPDTDAVQAFEQRFRDAYGRNPHPLAGLGYDGVATAVALAQRGRGYTPSDVVALRQVRGASGILRFQTDGTNRRSLAVAEIRNGQVVVLDRAPDSFGAFGL